MKKYYQIKDEKFHCETAARIKLQELKFESKQANKNEIIELWEISKQADIFGNEKTIKQLITRYTPNLPNNGVFRIQDSFDIRKAKVLYSMQKYDDFNHCWNNFKMGDDLSALTRFMNTYVEVK